MAEQTARGECPHCAWHFALRKDGKLRRHGLATWGADCPGSGGDPRDTSPDWADVREMARKAGYSVRTEPIGLRPVETKVWAHYPPGDRYPDASRGWARVAYGRDGACRISVDLHAPGRDPRSRIDLVDPTPTQVIAAARLVGIGGTP